MNITARIKERMQDLHGSAPVVIGFLGDSVTQGCFEIYRTPQDSIQTVFNAQNGYHNKLKQLFDTMFPQASVNILNAGISGDSAPSGAKRVKRDIIDRKPDLCVVCFGLNDSGRGIDGIDDYRAGLDSIFTQLKEAGIETLFMTPNMMATYLAKEGFDPCFSDILINHVGIQTSGTLDKYMEAAREVCAAHGITVCDCYRRWQKLHETGADITRLLANRVNHPTDEMNWLFAWSLFETIMDM